MCSPLLRLDLLFFQQLEPDLEDVQSFDPIELRPQGKRPALNELDHGGAEAELEERREGKERSEFSPRRVGLHDESERKEPNDLYEQLVTSLDVKDVVLEDLGRRLDGSELGLAGMLDDGFADPDQGLRSEGRSEYDHNSKFSTGELTLTTFSA